MPAVNNLSGGVCASITRVTAGKLLTLVSVPF